MAEQRVIIVGGGLAGLMGAMTACEQGLSVDMVSYVPVRRSHSVCARRDPRSRLRLKTSATANLGQTEYDGACFQSIQELTSCRSVS